MLCDAVVSLANQVAVGFGYGLAIQILEAFLAHHSALIMYKYAYI
jgi:hypothetical protein